MCKDTVELEIAEPQETNCLDCKFIESEFKKGVPTWFCNHLKEKIMVSRKSICKKFKNGMSA